MEEKTFCVTLYLGQNPWRLSRQDTVKGLISITFQISSKLQKFKNTGTLIKSTKKGQFSTSGKKLTARLPENVETVRDSVARSPKKSLRRLSQELGLSRSSVQEWPSVVSIQNPD